MKTKTNLIVIASFLALGGLQGQTAPATPAAPVATTAPAAATFPPLTVTIIVNDMMAYSVTKIEAHAGQTITVRIKNVGTLPKSVMGHNWILLKAGVNPISYSMSAASAKDEDFQPKALAGEVLASIPSVGSKETGETTFTAPTTPGTYNYICSDLGHLMAGMKGVLIVK
jgi:azurin